MELLQSFSLRKETWMRKDLFLLKQIFINFIDVSKRLFDFKITT